jgi:AcrR family transcriptional regulator
MARARTAAPRRPRRGPTRGEGTGEPRRTRRNPAEAREIILSAAERVLSERGPDAATLKDIAREAGVSHALVTHYFGTYGALVEETMARRVVALRSALTQELLTAPTSAGPRAVLRRLAKALMDPANMRLVAWALLSGRVGSADFFPARAQGLRALVDTLEARWRESLGTIRRSEVEFVVMSVVAMLHGYAFGRTALLGALGRNASEAADEEFIEHVADMVEAYLARTVLRRS